MDVLPRKLLDAEELALDWPELGYTPVGDVRRLDYSTNLHHGGIWTPYYHDFTTTVGAYAPRWDEDEDHADWVQRSVDPIVMGLCDRIYVSIGEQLFGGMREVDPGIGGPDPDVRAEIPPSALAWDPEHRKLLLVEQATGRPWLVLAGGELRLDEEAMIGG